MKFNKVFFIGLNKTGTYSIYKYLIENNFKAIHQKKEGYNTGFWYQKDLEYFNSHDIFITDFEHYNEDEIYLNFDFLNKNFPNSIFILNTRNLNNWLLSRLNHNKKAYYKEDKNELDEIDMLRWTKFRNNYYKKIDDFFKDKKLYKINIESNLEDSIRILQNIFELSDNKLQHTHKSIKKENNKVKVNDFLKKYIDKNDWENDGIVNLIYI